MSTTAIETRTLMVLTDLDSIRTAQANCGMQQLECQTLPSKKGEEPQIERHMVHYRGPQYSTGGVIHARQPAFNRDIVIKVHETIGGKASIFMSYSVPAQRTA